MLVYTNFISLNSILHLDLDTFFVSVERLKNSKLEGKPVLIGGTSDRGVVASCSYEARRFGIHSAMPMKMAKTLCPEAIIMKGNSADYSKYSRIVTEIIQQSVPVMEKASVDEFYVDLSGMDKFYGCMKMASELRKKVIQESGLPISFGLSENKTVSKVATNEAKPNNQIKIDYGKEKPFLAPLSVKKIPMVGDKTYQKLISLGVRKIQTLQEMPMELMERAFGKNGVSIWRKANGIDNSPVIPYTERKSISTERTFDKDTIDITRLKGLLTAMTENLSFQLRRGDKLCACITIKMRYSDFNTYTLQSRIPYTSADYLLIPKALELFEKLYNRRLLVRLVGIRLSDIVNGNHQIDLFDNQMRALHLYEAMDKIRDKHGDRAVMRVSGMDAKTIARWNPFNGEPPPLLANRHK
ncbi:MAG: DNA polymerase-4 [Cyclobacteriaceae bacterium]